MDPQVKGKSDSQNEGHVWCVCVYGEGSILQQRALHLPSEISARNIDHLSLSAVLCLSAAVRPQLCAGVALRHPDGPRPLAGVKGHQDLLSVLPPPIPQICFHLFLSEKQKKARPEKIETVGE